MSLNNYISYKSQNIYFEIKNKNIRSNNITIKVKPNCSVVISAPKRVTKTEIFNIVNNKAEWIYKKIEEFKIKNAQKPNLEYTLGESHYYLGKKYSLEILNNKEQHEKIKISENKFILKTYENSELLKKELNDWYAKQALNIFQERFDLLLEKTYWVKSRPKLVLKFMRSQWGSCSSSGKICLNIHLIKAPIECIDYVIYHELCHVLVQDHSKKFYALLEQVCPNWKEHRKYLRDKLYFFIN